MSENKQTRKRRAYHHGDLAEAMIQAALKLISEFGPAGFTFAEVTRVVGVSPAAPYRHFKDRDALMAAIAGRGFQMFSGSLAKAWGQGKPDPRTAFMDVGLAYLAFAREQPAYYAAMFEAQYPADLSKDLAGARDQAFSVLREAAEVMIADLPAGKRPPAMMITLHIWAMAHGIASLFVGRQPHLRSIPMEPEELLEAGILVYLDGLGLGAKS